MLTNLSNLKKTAEIYYRHWDSVKNVDPITVMYNDKVEKFSDSVVLVDGIAVQMPGVILGISSK